MSAVRSFLRHRIAMHLVMICMTMSFVVPSIRTDYIDLSGISHNAHEIHILDLRGMSDCILAVSPAGRSSRTAISKNNGKVTKSIIGTAGGTAFADTVRSVCIFISGISFVPAAQGACAAALFLIESIHLKDGSK